VLLFFRGYFHFIQATKAKLQQNVELKLVKGYAHCHINDSSFSLYEKEFQCDLDLKLEAGDTLVVTFVNKAWLGLARNWMCTAKKVGLANKTLLMSFETGVCSQLPGAACYEYPNASIQGSSFGEKEYQSFIIKRTEVILKLLACGHTLILVDADVAFLRNPLQFMKEKMGTKDIMFQTDSITVSFVDNILPYFFNYLCGGFIYMRSSRATRYLWTSVLQFQRKFSWNDQAGLNVCIRHPSQLVRWSVFSSDQFPNGLQYFMYRKRSRKNLMVHANHLRGAAEKMFHMVAANLWCDESSAVQVCRDQAVYKNKCTNITIVPQWCQEFQQVCKEKYSVEVIAEK